jgi:hypothetical protein
MSSLFVEAKNGDIEFRISLATNNQTDSSLPWSATFACRSGFLAAFHEKLRVTHLMFWPKYPACAFTREGQLPEEEAVGQGVVEFPEGSPMWYIKKGCPGVKFVRVSKQFYREEVRWGMKRMWRVVAVGRM